MSGIRILEHETNRRGDLFGQMMADLFVALGYEQPRLNIHKSGREVDLSTRHRLEARKAIGECKATVDLIGGDDLNKFVGALDAEHDDELPVTGYFISLSGFRETAIEQERLRRRTKITLLDGTKVIDELIKGRIIIGKERASDMAGRCCAQQNHLSLDTSIELTAHARGWIWIVYYTDGMARTHYVLVHADGTLLTSELSGEITVSDQSCGGKLHELICLNPKSNSHIDDQATITSALEAYKHYISEECGYFQLDGLPADGDVGSRRLKLENLFVPLHVDVNEQSKDLEVGAVLASSPRLALLAAPGGGKSTLIKRLAVAYADPARRGQVADGLPQRDWFPLFFRCRELRTLARASFAELLDALSNRDPVRQHAMVFRRLVDRALTSGRILLLVDGLDEISDPGDRAAFVCTMRTALQAYPTTSIVVTSREAGFRHVASHLAPICKQVTLSHFSSNDILQLSVAWHLEVVGDSEKVRSDASSLARTIVRNDRIRRLAVNPLLLTTLLLVKRWVGSLPTRRAILYGKAVEVLLMTWNTEGHEPIPEEEALPQLCYLASTMMLERVERISRPRLATILQEARSALPTELGYVTGTVEEFIHRVEDRSSLLMMTGLDVEDEQLVEFFEFRHLTFQEFLTARAMVQGWHPGRNEHDKLVNVLQNHLADEKWKEVIPLAASLGRKESEQLIIHLINEVNRIHQYSPLSTKQSCQFISLGSCLADEVASKPDTIKSAAQVLARVGLSHPESLFAPVLLKGRYGNEMRTEIDKNFLSVMHDVKDAVTTLQLSISHDKFDSDNDFNPIALADLSFRMLQDSDQLIRSKGALGFTVVLEHIKRESAAKMYDWEKVGKAVLPLLYSEASKENYVAGWTYYELARHAALPPDSNPDILSRMFDLWQLSPSEDVRRGLSTTLGWQVLMPRSSKIYCSLIDENRVKSLFDDFGSLKDSEKVSALIVAWYTRALEDQAIIRYLEESLHEVGLREESQLIKLSECLGVNPANLQGKLKRRRA